MTTFVSGAQAQTERDAIAELLWQILTHNTDLSITKYPIEALVEKVHAYRGSRQLLGQEMVDAFAEAASYMGIGDYQEPEEDPVALAFRAMADDVARAHRVH